METKIFYLRDLSLLLSIVYYCNSSILILERFLPHNASIFISIVSSTSLCHLAFCRLDLCKLFDSHYWPAFFVTSAYLATADDSTNWDTWRAQMLLIVGLAFLAVYCIIVGILSCLRRSLEKEGSRGTAVTPLLVQIAFVFIGNGVAMIGRVLIPEDGTRWVITGAAIMLCISMMFFYCFVRCSAKIESEIHPHTE